MKYLLTFAVILLVGCGPNPQPPVAINTTPVKHYGPDGCSIETSSNLVAKRNVSDILNLEKDIDPNGRCTVKFDLVVDGQTYHLEETETGYEQVASLCYYARERARKNLLLDLGGEYQSKSEISCKHTDG